MDHPPRTNPAHPERLPRELLAPVSWRELGGVLLGTLACFLAANLVASVVLERRPGNRGYWLIKEKWALADRLSGPVDCVVLGDSSGNQGIVPSVWQEETGESAVNLCTIGDMTALGDVWLLERVLRRGPPPKRVVLVHVYDMWERDLRKDLLAQVPVWGSEPSVDLELGERLEISLRRWFPLVAESVSLRAALDPRAAPRVPFTLDSSGYMALHEPDVARVRQNTADHLSAVRGRRFSLSATNSSALTRLFALAAEHGFELDLVPSPLHEVLAEDPEFQRYLSEVLAGLRARADPAEGVRLIEEIETFPEELMENSDHLIHEAAVEFTRRVARRVTSH